MNAVLFDTLKFATALQEDDTFSAKPSARLASALSATFESEIATKSDVRENVRAGELRLQAQMAATRTKIAEVESRLNARLAVIRTEIAEVALRLTTRLAETRTELTTRLADISTELTARLAETKADLLKWLVGAIGLQTVVIVVAVFGSFMTLAHLAR